MKLKVLLEQKKGNLPTEDKLIVFAKEKKAYLVFGDGSSERLIKSIWYMVNTFKVIWEGHVKDASYKAIEEMCEDGWNFKESDSE